MPKAQQLYTHTCHRPDMPARIMRRGVGRKRNMVELAYEDGCTYEAYPELLRPYGPSPDKCYYVRKTVVFEVIDKTTGEVLDITGGNDLAAFDTIEAAEECAEEHNSGEA